jgi:hypothetical protein
MAAPQIISPPKYYEVNGVVCPLLVAYSDVTTGGTRTVVAADSTRRHRIMGWRAQSAGAVGHLLINSPFQNFWAANTPADTSGTEAIAEIVDCGRGEAGTNEAITAVATTTNQRLTLYYITYTP